MFFLFATTTFILTYRCFFFMQGMARKRSSGTESSSSKSKVGQSKISRLREKLRYKKRSSTEQSVHNSHKVKGRSKRSGNNNDEQCRRKKQVLDLFISYHISKNSLDITLFLFIFPFSVIYSKRTSIVPPP